MNIDIEILLNQLAQGIKPIELGKKWFSNLSVSEQQEILSYLSSLITQAGAVGNDVQCAITQAQLKDTLTPCVLLLQAKRNDPLGSNGLRQLLAKVIILPPDEYGKSFLLFISLLGVADLRRRNNEHTNNCNHWWHRDLNDEKVLREIRENQQNQSNLTP